MVNTGAQQFKGQKIESDKFTVAADAGAAFASTCVPLGALGACPSGGSNVLQCVRDAGWYACQPDAGWAQLGTGAGSVTAVTGSGPILSTGGTAPIISFNPVLQYIAPSVLDSGFIVSKHGAQLGSDTLASFPNNGREGTASYATGDGGAEHHLFLRGPPNPDGGTIFDYYGDAGMWRQLPYVDEVVRVTDNGSGPTPRSIISKTGSAQFVNGQQFVPLGTSPFGEVPVCFCNDTNASFAGTVRPCGYEKQNSDPSLLVFDGVGSDTFDWQCFGAAIGFAPPFVFPPWVLDFASSDGRGSSAACACADVSSVQGDKLAYYRDGGAWCTKSSQQNHIAVGDMVICPSGKPRMMPGWDGGSWVGLLSEPSAVNFVVDPENFTTSNWTKSGDGVAAPTVTANACPAPSGAMTGTLVHFAASTSGTTHSSLFQNVTGPGLGSLSLYIRSFDGGTSGSLDAPCQFDGTAWHCLACDYAGLDYTRCEFPNITGTDYFLFGNSGNQGGRTLPAQDVCVWHAQTEVNKKVTSPVVATESGGRDSDKAFFLFANCQTNGVGRDPTNTDTVNPDVIGCPAPTGQFTTQYLLYPPPTWTMRGTPRGHNTSMSATIWAPHNVTEWPLFMKFQQASNDCHDDLLIEPGTGHLQCNYLFHDDGDQLSTLDAGFPQDAWTSIGCSFDGGGLTVQQGGLSSARVGAIKNNAPENNALGLGNEGWVFNGTDDTIDGGRICWECQGFGGIIKGVHVEVGIGDYVAWVTDNIAPDPGGYSTGGYANLTNRWTMYLYTPASRPPNGTTVGQAFSDLPRLRSYHTRLFISVGNNDLLGGAAGATTWATVQAAVDDERTKRLVILSNLTPFKNASGWTTAIQTEQDAFNSAWTSYCSGAPSGVICVDVRSALWASGDHASLATANDSGDHFTLSSDGSAAFTSAVATAAP